MSCIQLTAKTLVASMGVVGVSTFFAVPAGADPADDPCGMAVSFLCRFIPIAPGLDGDVDLTKQLPAADPAAPLPDSLPTADICSYGCI
jgi:hypothetical protein